MAVGDTLQSNTKVQQGGSSLKRLREGAHPGLLPGEPAAWPPAAAWLHPPHPSAPAAAGSEGLQPEQEWKGKSMSMLSEELQLGVAAVGGDSLQCLH
jgi:hypothetical protein